MRKVRKEVEDYAQSIGIIAEVVKEAKHRREQDEVAKVEKAAPAISSARSRQTGSSAPSSDSQKPARSLKSEAKSFNGEGKRKKGKGTRVYVVLPDDEEMESDEVVKEMKSKGTKATKSLRISPPV